MIYNKIMTIVICILITLIILLSISGCKSLPIFGGGGNVSTLPIPSKPTEQLWDAVKKSNWLVTFSILGIAAGFFAFLNGSKMGIPAIGASCVSLFMALAVARFATWMAICGMIGSVASVGISIIVKNRALREIICNVQAIKKEAKENGNSISQKQIELRLTNQEKSTKKVVQKIKSALKIRGEL